jgi:formylglycine-generating enzyme required for sulfatase activity
MSLFMGIYLATRFKKWIELAWGAVLFFVCTLPVIGMFIGIGYFARAYVKLEKARWGEGVGDALSALDEFTAEGAQSKEDYETKENAIIAVLDKLDESRAAGEVSVADYMRLSSKYKEQWREIMKQLGRMGERVDDVQNTLGMEFVLIPAGEFEMGSEECDTEGPVHHAKIGKAFYMGRYEVTQKQWREIMGVNPSTFRGPDLPVEEVSWDDIQEFITHLNGNEGTDRYRLPSEAEWEYACRAGTTTRYSFGDDGLKLSDYAWYGGNAGNKTHPVGQKLPNSYGLYDMHGNVWEWVQDRYHDDYDGAPTDGSAWEGWPTPRGIDPLPPLRGACWDTLRVGRGGCFISFPGDHPETCRSAIRRCDNTDDHCHVIGFRLLKEL